MLGYTQDELLNRHAFDQRLRQAFANCKDSGVQHVLLYMDLDQFKLVNNTCGHVAGDMMLRQLSHRLRRTIDGDDVLARLGGDEFGLSMENCQLEQAQRLATKICSVVKDYRFTWEGRTFSTGVSIGIVAIGPNTESPHSALSSAIGHSLGDGSLHEHILEQLRKYNLPAEKISFEITETAVVSRLYQAARFISLLKRRGFRFALDDFGTGMSSFSYLKRLPVDYLKIDGSFVSNMVNDPIDRAMLESINEIGHLTGLQTVA
jgi:diguanylate cyclase (GGDEF)-like protein